VVRATSAAIGIGQVARFGLGRGNDVLHALEGRVRAHHQHQRAAFDQTDRRQVLQRIEIDFLEHGRVDRQRCEIAHADGVTVGLGPHDGFGADVAASAGFVVHHDGDAEHRVQETAELARALVGVAAGRVGADDGDGFARVLVLGERQAGQPQYGGGLQKIAAFHERLQKYVRYGTPI